MSRRVKEFIDISDFSSLDDLIAKLEAIREGLPDFSEAELRLIGDDVFGRKLTISFMREQTEDEASYDARYADVIRAAQQQAQERVQQELDETHLPAGRRRRAA